MLGALLVAVCVVWATTSLRRRHRPAAASEAPVSLPVREPEPNVRSVAASPSPGGFTQELVEPATSSFGRPNPVVERVIVDKLEVCSGEENFAHVDVSTVDGTDADLKISLTGTVGLNADAAGRRLPFRLFGAVTAEEMPVVTVLGAGGTHAERRLPLVKVKNCEAPPYLIIEPHLAPENGLDAYTFDVRGADATTRSHFEWKFGDGQSATTQEGKAAHDYGSRLQVTRFSDFLISVTTTEESGRVVSGYQTLELFNREYWKHRTGT